MELSSAAASASRRRRPRKGDLTERAILECTERLLSEKPLREIGIDEIARAVGISRPAFYFYFESKDAVLQVLVERLADRAYAASEHWLSRTDEPPEDAVREGISASAELWRDYGPVLRAAVDAWELGSGGKGFWAETVNRFIEATATQIRREREAGAAPAGGPSPKALATALVWMNERCFYTASLGAGPSLAQREIVPTLTTIWLRAIYGDEVAEPSS
jgi:TetR/AcrR family transcriptional regulator, ethionamide resistance regulator